MFRALLCPSLGARQTAVAASGFPMNVEVEVFSAVVGLLANPPRLTTLMMGIVMPETCWVVSVGQSNKFYDWLLHLVGCYYLSTIRQFQLLYINSRPIKKSRNTLFVWVNKLNKVDLKLIFCLRIYIYIQRKVCLSYTLFIKFPPFHSAKSRVHLESRSLVSCHRIVAICRSVFEDLSLENGIAAAALLSEDNCRPRFIVDDKQIPQNRMKLVPLLALSPLEHPCSEYFDILSAGRNST